MTRWVFLALAGGLTAAHAEPLVRTGTSFYYIDGASALVLTEQMKQKGPTGVDGNRHPARTKWDVQWKFRHNMHDGLCKMEEVAVAVGITTIRPRWRNEATGSASLKARWNRFIDAIDRGANFHSEQATRAGTQIEAALTGLKTEKTCDALTETANKSASEILDKRKASSEDYDQRTDYGRKDGASLI
ncbi:MAG: DUF922 domain-containing protein [Burkholderiales bacterium]